MARLCHLCGDDLPPRGSDRTPVVTPDGLAWCQDCADTWADELWSDDDDDDDDDADLST